MNPSDRPPVLLVDDVEANLVALEAQLSQLDCDLVRATSGNEALRILLRRDFAVMLLDVQMPGMDGYEVARYARDNPATRDVPIVFVTAMHESEEGTLRGYGAGAIDFLFKPVNPHILIGKVRVFTDLYASRRRLADEVEAHKRTLAELEAFNYSVSHDLRAPLRSLSGFSKALLQDHAADLAPAAADYLNRIDGNARRMGQLIDDLLRLSRLGRTEMNVRPVDLAQLAGTIVAGLQRDEPGRKVEFVCLPEARVDADPGLLRIALENLLRNAWKFTQRKDAARIELGRKDDEAGRAVYFLRDDGAGFDPAYSDRLFQPFRRLHDAAEFEGTGIGLAIVQRVMRRHGGDVWAEGAPGEGATFYFTLGERP